MSSLIDKFGHRVNIGNSNFHLTKNIPTFNIFERLEYDNGIYYPDNIYMSSRGNWNQPISSGFAYFASNLPQTWSLSTPNNTYHFVFYLGGSLDKSNINVLYNYYNYVSGETVASNVNFDLVISVTDGIVTYSKNVTVHIQDNAYYIGSNFLLDTSPIGQYGLSYGDNYTHYDRNSFNSVQTKDSIYSIGYADSTKVIHDPKGNLRFDNGLGYISTTPSCAIVSNHIGRNDFTIGLGIDQPTQFWIIKEQPMYINPVFKQVYTHVQPGEVIGDLNPFSDAGIAKFVVVDSTDPIVINAYGKVIALASPTVGNKIIHVNCISLNGKVTPKVINYTVLQGNLLPSSNMSFSYVSGIDNYSYQVSVGTASVTGLTGTAIWSVTNDDDIINGFEAGPANYNHFLCNSSTGVISLRVGIPARTHVMHISVTDGPNRCIAAINLSVPWHAGPTFHVGRGMSATYPGTGYEHLADALRLFSPLRYGQVCDANVAGATIIVHADADPNYYANDFNNGDYGLRTGWHGPVKIVGASTTGIRPRVGGIVGTAGNGVCPGDKEAYFNIDVGDVVIDGFEVSFVNSGYDQNHGFAGIRKNASTWGDVTVLNCDIHDCDNGLEVGFGSFWAIVKNNRFGNCGTSYVGSGATHNIYASCCAHIIFQDNLSLNCVNGHVFKSRALGGIVTGNRLYDGERGAASNIIDIPEGGNYLIINNDIHKGPNQMNPYCIQVAEENYLGDINGNTNRRQEIVISNNRISVICLPGTRSYPSVPISAGSAISNIEGRHGTVTLLNNSFYIYDNGVRYANTVYGVYVDPIVTESNSVMLTIPFALNTTTDPDHNRTAPLSHLGSFLRNNDGLSGSNYDFNNDNQFSSGSIDTHNEDIRISASAGVGTLVANLTANGTIFTGLDIFGNGTTWSFNTTPEFYQTLNWPPSGRYTISSNANGSGQIVVSGALPPAGNVDVFKIRATATTGLHTDHRFYVVIV